MGVPTIPTRPSTTKLRKPAAGGGTKSSRKNEVVITDFLEVVLFPLTSIDERDVIFAECEQGIGFRID
jgi:hypothetical protein